jgi:Amt family ammonium transporter
VHLVCGVWGTLAVGIFSTNPEHSFGTQLIGVGAYGVAAFGSSLAIFGGLKALMGIRVSEGEEFEGLDLAEHGGHAYDLTGPTSILETVTGPAPAFGRRSTALANEQA